MSAILWLDQISKSDLLLVGGKGANLGEMSKAGFPVPRGFCITTSAYRRQIEETIIGRNLPGLLAGPRETLSEALGPLFLNTSILPEIETEIRDAYRRIGEGARVAVRSSATAEDLPEASFAGQQETFLGISGVEALLLAVRRCWASLWSSRAIHYREKQGINHASVGLAVVVQEMVAADVAGVMFTVNPVTGAADEAVITASYGLGEAVVSGLVIPDTYVVSKQRLTISKRESGRKESKVVQEGQGTVVIPMPAAEQENKLCLPDATVAEIARAGLNVERHYGEPQDIEWALAGGQLYVLQARPVTALPKGSQQPPLPGLEDDVHGWIYVGRMPSFIRRRLLPSIPDHFPRPLRPFDISCNTAAALDGARRVAAELGIKLPADVVRPHESGLVLFSPPLPSVFRILLRLPFMWRGLKEWTRYDPGREWREVDELALRPMLPAAPSSETTMEQSLAGIDRLRGVITELMYRRFRKYMAAGAAAHRRLTVLLRRLYGDEAARVKQQLMLSLDHKTALSNRAMKDLARSAASTPAVREILTSRPFGAMHAAILADPRCGAFAGQLARFLGEFGDRTALTMEPQPSYPAWADEPDQVLGLIATTIRYPDSLVDHTARDEETYRRARAEIAARLARKPRLAAKFEWAVDTARSFVVAREASLYFLRGGRPDTLLRWPTGRASRECRQVGRCTLNLFSLARRAERLGRRRADPRYPIGRGAAPDRLETNARELGSLASTARRDPPNAQRRTREPRRGDRRRQGDPRRRRVPQAEAGRHPSLLKHHPRMDPAVLGCGGGGRGRRGPALPRRHRGSRVRDPRCHGLHARHEHAGGW